MSFVFDDSTLDRKLTRELIESLSNLIRTSVCIEVALRLCGVTPKETARWLRLANEQPGSIFQDFRDSLNKADAERERMLVSLLTKAALNGDTKATMFMLSQQFPQRWGKMASVTSQDPLTLSAEDEHMAISENSSALSNLPIEQKQAILDILDSQL